MERLFSTLLLVFCLYGFTYKGNATENNNGSSDSVHSLDSALDNITTQIYLFPQEKLYVQTDKPYYISGETVFFRAFLLNASSHKPTDFSRYMYVELINPLDSVVIRQQIRPENNLFYGTLTLPEDLSQGNYRLRAYTRFMENIGEDYFYTHYFHIDDPYIAQLETQTEYEYINDKELYASIRFVNIQTKKVLTPQKISLRLNDEKLSSYKPDNEGWIKVKLNLPKDGKRTLYIEFEEDGRFFTQFVGITYPKGEIHVSFCPEGGNLVSGQLSKVAFQIQSSDGRNPNLEGVLLDSKENVITNFTAMHDGMGYFSFTPESGERYSVLIDNKRFDLPASNDAYSLKTVWRQNKLWISTNKGHATIGDKYLIIHSQGNVYHADKWNEDMNMLIFEQQEIPSGISHILLLTEDLQTISERLAFNINEKEEVKTSITASRENYRSREQVKMNIDLKDANGKGAEGDFAISVTDDKDIRIDTTNTIKSTLLLTSELRGKINNPGYYLNSEHSAEADLLMMIHGWTRYDIPKAMRGDFQYLSVPNEEAQSFSGIVKGGLLSKPYKGSPVTIISTNTSFFDKTETDENGRFSFTHFEFPDSTTYIIQALTKRKGSTVELELNEKTWPKVSHNPYFVSVSESNFLQEKEHLDYVSKADMKYTIENGMRTYNLAEVVIHGRRTYRDEEQHRYAGLSRVITADEIEKGGADIITLIRRLGIQVILRANPSDPTVVKGGGGDIQDMMYIGGKLVPIPDELLYLDPSDLEAIGTIPTSHGLMPVPILKSFDKRMEKPRFNKTAVTPLGYQRPVEFYSPRYDSPEARNSQTPDLRSTIYWKPDVVADKDGKSNIDFYTADTPSTYSVIIEGVTPDGKLIYHKEEAIVKVLK